MPGPMSSITRRKFLAGSAAALALSGRAGRLWAEGQPTPGRPRIHPSKRGHRLAVLPFDGVPEVSFGVTQGKGLYGRRLLDLSDLDDATLITPADRYYVRTRAPEFLPPGGLRLTVRTLTGPPLDLPLEE